MGLRTQQQVAIIWVRDITSAAIECARNEALAYRPPPARHVKFCSNFPDAGRKATTRWRQRYLTAGAPQRMSVYDARALEALKLLGCPDLSGDFGRYMDTVCTLMSEVNDARNLNWHPRDVDQALYISGNRSSPKQSLIAITDDLRDQRTDRIRQHPRQGFARQRIGLENDQRRLVRFAVDALTLTRKNCGGSHPQTKSPACYLVELARPQPAQRRRPYPSTRRYGQCATSSESALGSGGTKQRSCQTGDSYPVITRSQG